MKTTTKFLSIFLALTSFAFADDADTDLNTLIDETSPQAEAFLEDFEVTAYRFPTDSLSVPVNTHVITKEDIQDSASSTIPEILQKEGNVRFMSYTGSYADGNLAMRGFGENSQSRILILVDGVKYNPSDMSSINWSTIPLDSVDSIEILRGSQTTMYGGNAEAGVIKITTIKPTDGYQASIKALYGSYDLYDISLSASGREGDAFYSANLSTYNFSGYRDYSSSWSNYGSFMAGYDFSENTTLTLKGDFSDSYIEYANGLTWDNFINDPNSASYSTMAFRDKTGLYTANLVSSTESANIDATFGVKFRDREIYDYGSTIPNLNNQWTYSFSPRLEITSIENTNIYAGIDANYTNIDYKTQSYVSSVDLLYNSRDSNADRIDLGIYAGATHNLFEDLIFSAGARADTAYTAADWSTYYYTNSTVTERASYSGNNWDTGYSANLGVTYKLNNQSSLFARFDQVFHYPTVDEIAYYQSSSSTPFNLDLKPEHGQNYEIGYKFQNKQWSATLNGFLMYLHDEIMYDPVLYLNSNLDPTIKYGVDFALSYDDKYYGASVSGTFVKSQFASGQYSGNEVPLVSPFNITAQVYVRPIECLTLLARITYYTSSVMGSDFDNVEDRIPSYYTIDLQANARINDNITIFGAIDNVTDEVYAVYAYYGTYYPSSGLTLKIGINIKL